MTPAIDLLRTTEIEFNIHEYKHDSDAESYGLEAAEKLNVEPERILKTLVVQLDTKELVVGLVPVPSHLSLKALAKAVGAKKVSLANEKDVTRATGYILGGVSPLGQKRKLQAVIDLSAKEFSTIFVSAGRRGLEIELSPLDLVSLLDGDFAAISEK